MPGPLLEPAGHGASRWLELGLGLVVIAVPLAFLPSTSGPFLDLKLLLLTVGSAAIWFGRTPTRHPLVAPAAAWIAIGAVAAVAGVDPWRSLLGSERNANGLLLLATSGFLLVAGTSVPAPLLRRIPRWLVGTATTAGAVALLERATAGSLPWVDGLSFEGGTIGHPVFLAILLAAGIAAAVGLAREMAPLRLGLALVVMTSALALSTKRVGWVALAVGLGVALVRSRLPYRRMLLIVSVVGATAVGWVAVDASLGVTGELTGTSRFGELATGSARSRLTAAPVLVRAWGERPVLGWGPGNTWSGFLGQLTGEELARTERGMNDAHSLILEAAVTTGTAGVIGLLWLGVAAARAVRRGPRANGWAAGAAAALLIGHLLQPINVTLTPLLFLVTGLACAGGTGGTSSPPASARRRAGGRMQRVGGGVAVTVACCLAATSLVASALERYAGSYVSEPALRAAAAAAPWRVSATRALALHLALDAGSGDRAAREEAASLAAGLVEAHPWHPAVRLIAADVHLVLDEPDTAVWWVEQQVARFPADESALRLLKEAASVSHHSPLRVLPKT